MRIAKAHERGVIMTPDSEALVEKTEAGYGLKVRSRFLSELDTEQASQLANSLVGRFLQERGVQTLRRIVAAPKAEKLETFRERALALGVPWRTEQSLKDYLEGLDPKDGRTLPLREMATRLNSRATYDTRPLGHDALKLDAYDHFTAPMRRYSDFVTHRVLAALIEGTPVPYQEPGALDGIVQKLDKASRRESLIERETKALVAAQLLQTRIGEKRRGVVMDVDPGGLTVRLDEPPCDVHVSAALMSRLTKNTFALDQGGVALWNGVTRFTIGDKLELSILAVNADGEAELTPTSMLPRLLAQQATRTVG
jgi:exoribonuclease R